MPVMLPANPKALTQAARKPWNLGKGIFKLDGVQVHCAASPADLRRPQRAVSCTCHIQTIAGHAG